MTPDEFDAAFDRATRSVFRLETLQQYTVGAEEAAIEAFRRGDPRPERSVRTSPWLARIATSTVAGVEWSRIHVVDEPLSEYVRYEVNGYVESQAAGERIGIAPRGAARDLDGLRDDFWLFDAGTSDAYAVLMSYDQDGRWLGADLTADTAVLADLVARRDVASRHAVPLNVYLSSRREERRVA